MVRAWERSEVQLFPSPLPHQLHLVEIEEPIQVERGTLDSARLQEALRWSWEHGDLLGVLLGCAPSTNTP